MSFSIVSMIRQKRIPGQAGKDVGEVEFFSYLFKFCRINQQDCMSFPRKWESAVADMLALDYYVDFVLSKISCDINTAKLSAIIKIS